LGVQKWPALFAFQWVKQVLGRFSATDARLTSGRNDGGREAPTDFHGQLFNANALQRPLVLESGWMGHSTSQDVVVLQPLREVLIGSLLHVVFEL
jgi:hypothetical protein